MVEKLSFNLSLNRKLILIMLFLSFILISVLMFLYSQSEQTLFSELERQTRELTKAIQIGVEEVTASGATDEARLSKYLKELNAKGVKEISIISNADEIVASTNMAKIGQPLTHKRKELIIKAELGEPISDEGSTYNVIVPVVAGNTQYGYIHLKINKDDFSQILRINALKRIAATIFVFGIGIIMALILSKRYTRPIQNVVDAAMRVAAGDLNQNIPVQSRDEIGQLSESFNFMVQKLRETRTLEEKLREAEHLSGLGQLSRNMAHEIRNTLTLINLSIEHIAD
jgi:nitrogen fixation/metabolism regulation signal transduction histidine kinase